jgi:hypothetical protein
MLVPDVNCTEPVIHWWCILFMQEIGFGSKIDGSSIQINGRMLQCKVRVSPCTQEQQGSTEFIHKHAEIHVSIKEMCKHNRCYLFSCLSSAEGVVYAKAA